MTISTGNELAIVIPAYKPEFLGAALASIAAQTDRNAMVYVCDDNSPGNLEEIAAPFSGQLNIRYHRFEKNVGGQSLVEQWNRSIRLSSEPWVWLFSDDDTMDAGCVEAWRKALAASPPVDLYRFNTRTIDQHGNITRWNPPHPEMESSRRFVYHRLSRTRLSFGCEYIFSRQAFDREGGMIPFPLAWCSDDASWAAFGRETGIRTITGPMVSWRYSGYNLSSAGAATRTQKESALLQYMDWLHTQFSKELNNASDPDWSTLNALLPGWFLHQLLVADCPLRRSAMLQLKEATGQSGVLGAKDYLRMIRHWSALVRRRIRTRLLSR